jgi:hypothetical protein
MISRLTESDKWRVERVWCGGGLSRLYASVVLYEYRGAGDIPASPKKILGSMRLSVNRVLTLV